MTAPARLTTAVAAIACAVLLGACGHDDGGRSAAAAAAVSQTFLTVSAHSGQRLTNSEAACLGTGVIDHFGVDQSIRHGFLAKGIKPAKSLNLTLSTKDAGTYADLYIRCADPTTIITHGLVARIAPPTAAKRQQLQACLDKTLTRALLRKVLVAAASGDTSNASLTALFTACGQLG